MDVALGYAVGGGPPILGSHLFVQMCFFFPLLLILSSPLPLISLSSPSPSYHSLSAADDDSSNSFRKFQPKKSSFLHTTQLLHNEIHIFNDLDLD